MRASIMTRRGRLVASGLVLAGLIAAATVGFTFLHGTPATHASGSGGGGGCTTMQTSACTYSGLTANAEFDNFDNGVYTGVSVWASENVSHAPPATPTTQSQVFVQLNTVDQSTGAGTYAWGDASGVAFTADSKLNTATLTATVPMTDNTGATFDVTLNLTWNGYGSTVSWDNNTHFRGDGFMFSSHDHSTSRNATASGTALVGTTNYAANPSMYNYISDSTGGSVQITR